MNDNKQEYEPLSTKLSKSKKVSALVYKSLVRKQGEAPRNSQKKWLMDRSCLSSENLDRSSAYLLALWCTKSTKLIEFHFKLFHRRLATNNFLFKIKLKENGNCTSCQNAPETLIHLFWKCQKTSKLWKSVMEWLQNMNIIQNNFTLLNTTALGLKPGTSKYALQINYCLLLARYHIWLAKTNETIPHFEHYLLLLKSRCELETKVVTGKNGNLLQCILNFKNFCNSTGYLYDPILARCN